MPYVYDYNPLKLFISRAINDSGPGTQSRLAAHLKVGPPEVNRWAKQVVTPAPVHWAELEKFFGWEKGTIEDVAGFRMADRPQVEDAVLHDEDLDDEQRDALVNLYRCMTRPGARGREVTARTYRRP